MQFVEDSRRPQNDGRRKLAKLMVINGVTQRELSQAIGWKAHSYLGRLIRGEVHDENAYFLGGVSGHAGLFSSGHDLARFAQMMLRHGVYDGVRVVSAAAVDTFTRVQNPALSNRALGWEVPDGTNSAGHDLSAHAFGHTGFTGTSIWIDPERDRFIILLTNRVDPTRQNTRIFGVRTALADAVAGVEGALGSSAGASSP